MASTADLASLKAACKLFSSMSRAAATPPDPRMSTFELPTSGRHLTLAVTDSGTDARQIDLL